ncbi:MAG: nucleotidyltransferase family protein [Chloroflexota bacterium]
MEEITERPKKTPCCGDLPPEARDVLGVIGSCARAEGNELQYCRLIKQTDQLVQWHALARHAEEHKLAPLVYRHLKAIQALAPDETMRELKALALRHRHANQVRGRALAEILHALRREEIAPLVLKGAALAHLVYPEPGLRPMRDIDLLVARSDLARAAAVLQGLGYCVDAQLAGITPDNHHHLPGLRRAIEGLSVSVELHHNLFPQTVYYRPLDYAALVGRAVPFEVQGAPALAPGYEDMLWHVYRHALGPPLLLTPLRLSVVADLSSLVELRLEQIDWADVRRRYPQVWNILPLLHFVSPWSPAVCARLDWDLEHAPDGAGQPYAGWPRRKRIPGGLRANRHLLQATFSPPEWWLRLFYGAGSPAGAAWARCIRHPLHVLEWRIHYWKEAFRRPARPGRG